MSLITRCPECQTMFRVVPDQLRISEGWVRCGQCEAVFDANLHMQDPEALEQPLEQVKAVEGRADPAQFEPQKVPATSPTLAASSSSAPSIEAQPAEVLETQVPEPEAEPDSEPLRDPKEPSWHNQADASAAPIPVNLPSSEGERTFTQAAIGIALPPGLSFVHDNDLKPLWQRPWMRAILGLLAAALSLTLVLQVLLQERDRLAANAPALKPVLQSLCEVFACQVQALRQIESIVIESSSFNKIRGDVYRLNLTIKNTAAVELALPAIELSLTDTTDQPLMRKVFLSGEFGSPSKVIAANSESVSSLALSIKANPATERISGYRVLAFYP